MSDGIAPLARLQGTEPVASAPVASANARADVPSGTVSTPAEATVTQAPLHPNPALHIDAALRIVVMEFYDDSGKVVSSIPTSQQLAAYRRSASQGTAHPASGAAGQAAPGTDTNGTATAATAGTATPATATGTSATAAAAQESTAPTQSTNPPPLAGSTATIA